MPQWVFSPFSLLKILSCPAEFVVSWATTSSFSWAGYITQRSATPGEFGGEIVKSASGRVSFLWEKVNKLTQHVLYMMIPQYKPVWLDMVAWYAKKNACVPNTLWICPPFLSPKLYSKTWQVWPCQNFLFPGTAWNVLKQKAGLWFSLPSDRYKVSTHWHRTFKGLEGGDRAWNTLCFKEFSMSWSAIRYC